MSQKLELEIPVEVENLKLPNPSLLSLYKLNEHRIIYIDYEINDGLLEVQKEILLYNLIDDDMNIPKETRRPIKLMLNTPGGQLLETFSFIDIIKISETPVWTYNCGAAYSAGIVILTSGHKRFTFKNAKAMFHQLSVSELNGTASEVEEAQKRIAEYNESMFNTVYENTSITSKVHKKKIKEDWYFNAEEQVKYGIVDEIVTSMSQIIQKQ